MTQSGVEQLVWTGRQAVQGRHSTHAPITISPGSLGAYGLVRLSPLHRVLVKSPTAALLFGHPTVLIAAKHLLPLTGIAQTPTDIVTYVHLMTRQHRMLRSAGVWCESFQAGYWARRGLSPTAQAKLAQLVPSPEGLRPAFPVVSGRDARLLVHQLQREEAPLSLGRAS